LTAAGILNLHKLNTIMNELKAPQLTRDGRGTPA
jgi:hypothetical protein